MDIPMLQLEEKHLAKLQTNISEPEFKLKYAQLQNIFLGKYWNNFSTFDIVRSPQKGHRLKTELVLHFNLLNIHIETVKG